MNAHPLAKMGRRSSQIHGHIEDFTLHDAHKFALWMLNLVMQAAQNTFGGFAVVVLDKMNFQTRRFVKVQFVEAFKKETSGITEDLRLQDHDFGQGRGGSGVRHTNRVRRSRVYFLSKFNKYCP